LNERLTLNLNDWKEISKADYIIIQGVMFVPQSFVEATKRTKQFQVIIIKVTYAPRR
jgi:hypothetical protein